MRIKVQQTSPGVLTPLLKPPGTLLLLNRACVASDRRWWAIAKDEKLGDGDELDRGTGLHTTEIMDPDLSACTPELSLMRPILVGVDVPPLDQVTGGDSELPLAVVGDVTEEVPTRGLPEGSEGRERVRLVALLVARGPLDTWGACLSHRLGNPFRRSGKIKHSFAFRRGARRSY